MLARRGALRVAAGGSAPPIPCVARRGQVAPGRDEKAGSSIEPESWIWDTIFIVAVRSGLSVTAPADAQFRVCRVQRGWLGAPADRVRVGWPIARGPVRHDVAPE